MTTNCSKHGKPFILLCSTCNVLVCKKCIPQLHVRHVFYDIDTIKQSDDYKKKIESLWDQAKNIVSSIKSLKQTEKDIKDFYRELHDLLIQEEHKAKKIVTSEIEKSYSMIPQIIEEISTTKLIVDNLMSEKKDRKNNKLNNKISNNSSSGCDKNEDSCDDSAKEEIISTDKSNMEELYLAIDNAPNINEFLSIETLFPKSKEYSPIEILYTISKLKSSSEFKIINYAYKYDIEKSNIIRATIPTLNDLYDRNRILLHLVFNNRITLVDIINNKILNTHNLVLNANSYSFISGNGISYIFNNQQLSVVQKDSIKPLHYAGVVPQRSSLCLDKKNKILYSILLSNPNSNGQFSDFSQYGFRPQFIMLNQTNNSKKILELPTDIPSGFLFCGDSAVYLCGKKTIYKIDKDKKIYGEYFLLEEKINGDIITMVSDGTDSLFILTLKRIYHISIKSKCCEKITKYPISCHSDVKVVYVDKLSSTVEQALLIFNIYKDRVGCFDLFNRNWSEMKLPSELSGAILGASFVDGQHYI